MLAIKNNLMAVNAARYLGQSYDALAKSVERLSSGLRINSAKDDAAGMAVRELMRADIAVLEQGARNAQDGISLLQTMEGAMGTIDTCLVRMKQLAEQAATGSYSEDQRIIMNSEFVEMAAEVERIATSTKFNDIAMLNKIEDATDVTIRFGTGADDEINVERADMTKEGLEIETGSGGTDATGKATNGVATADSTFITTTDETSTLSITFDVGDHGAAGGDDEKTIDVVLAAGAHTLNEVADAINLASQNLGNDGNGNDLNYTAAEVVTVMDGATQKYTLKLSSRTSSSDGLTMTTDDSVISGALGTDETDLTLNLDVDTDAAGINILDVDTANIALTAVTNAITSKDTARASFGYKMNRLESTVSVLNIQTENLMTAESRISDVDVATEMAEMTRNQVLAQAGTAMLAQANAIPQMALTLLR